MKKLFGSIALTMAMLVFAPSSQAQDFRPYAGIGLGGYIIDTGVAGVGNQTTFGGFGQFGVDVGEYFGGELRLGTSSKTTFVNSGSNEEMELDYVFSYLAKVQFPVSEELRLYALVGGSSGRLSAKLTTPGFVFVATGTNTLTNDQTSFSVGGGIDFQFHDHMSIGAEYMRYFSDVSGFSANLKYLF